MKKKLIFVIAALVSVSTLAGDYSDPPRWPVDDMGWPMEGKIKIPQELLALHSKIWKVAIDDIEGFKADINGDGKVDWFLYHGKDSDWNTKHGYLYPTYMNLGDNKFCTSEGMGPEHIPYKDLSCVDKPITVKDQDQ